MRSQPALSRRARKRAARAVLVLLGIATGGCALLRSTPAPIPTIELARATAGSECSVVLLPGRGGHPDDFVEAGFADLMAARGIEAEVIGVDAHLGYYARRTVLERLEEDVMAPRQGRRLYLVGVSMGGLGALLYQQHHPGRVAGIVLLAPFLGSDAVTREVERGGGLRAWRPERPVEPDDYQRQLWLWLREDPLREVPVFLGWGRDDAFHEANSLLAATLPPGRVAVVDGGHDWQTWREIWARMLDAGALAPCTRGGQR